MKSVSKYNDFMGRYSDTNVEKCGILSLKLEENGEFLEIEVMISSQGNGSQGRSNRRVWEGA
jgi:hypothetical protein